jgi:hypothetical protein
VTDPDHHKRLPPQVFPSASVMQNARHSLRAGLLSNVRFPGLPEHRVGIAEGIHYAGFAEVGRNDGTATFTQQLELRASLAQGFAAPLAGRPVLFIPAVHAKVVHNVSLNPFSRRKD